MPRRLPSFFCLTEADAMMRAAPSERDRLLLLCGFFLGLRVSELTKLRIEEVNLDAGKVFVNQGKGARDRYVPIPDRIREPLRAWMGERREGWLFPSPRKDARLSTRSVQRIVKRIAALAGVVGAREARKATPHKMRHFYGSRLLETGADLMQIRDLLGHQDLSTTQIYLHTTPERLRAAVNRL